MKNLVLFLILGALTAGSVMAQPRVMSLTTIGDSKFNKYIVLKASRENTPVQIDFGDGNLVNETIGTKQSWFLNTLAGSTYAKIYGDSIISLWALGEVTSLDISGNPDLLDLNCAGGKLTELDLTKNEALESVDCSYNLLTELDLSHNQAIKSLNFNHNQLSAIDLSAQALLKSLECDQNLLTNLGVTQHPLLSSLDCHNNFLTHLDVTQNPKLANLNCSNNQITELNVSKNQDLRELNSSNNLIQKLITSRHAELMTLDCENNMLDSLDIRNLPNLLNLSCANNELNLSTLPLRQPSMKAYLYAPQHKMSIQDHMGTGEMIDLSHSYKVDQIETEFFWKKGDGTLMVENTDYVVTKGKTVFFRNPGDSVYCEMKNRYFSDLSGDNLLRTGMIAVTGPFAAAVMHSVTVPGKMVTLSIKADISGESAQIDFGDGYPVEFILDTAITISHSISGSGNLVVYCDRITGLDVSYTNLTDLFINPALPLQELDCSFNFLSGLKLSTEIPLRSFFCHHNRFDLSSLPVPQNSWEEYGYAPQEAFFVQPDTSGTEVDLNSQCQVNGIPTIFSWTTKDGIPLVENTDFVLTEGIATFILNPNDSVFCKMSNPLFPGFTGTAAFCTMKVKVNGKAPMMSFSPYIQPCQGCSVNTLSFFIKADDENTPIQVDFGDGNLVDMVIGKTETRIDKTGRFKNGLQIRLYGKGLSAFRSNFPAINDLHVSQNPFLKELICNNNDISALKLGRNRRLIKLNLRNCNIYGLDLTKNQLLQELNCSANNLGYLELYNNPALHKLDFSSNKFQKINVTENTFLDTLICTGNELSSLDVSRNPQLTSLECEGNKLTRLDISENVKLKHLDCSANQLESIDVRTCPELSYLDCMSNNIKVLDLFLNPKLTYLRCRSNHLSSLILKQNPLLKTLDCESNTLTELDISKCDSLQLVECLFNKIESLDLSRLYELTSLNVVENNLKELDISHNTKLKNCWYYGNRLTFATLPAPWPTWEWFVYAPQQPVFINPSIALDDSIDLSDQFRIGSDTTLFVWKDATGTPLLEGTDYLIRNGVTRFLLVQPDSVFCEMSNSLLPQFDEYKRLVTTRTQVSIPSQNKTIENAGIRILYSHGRCFLDAPFEGTYRLFDMTGRLVAFGIVQKGLNEITYPQTGVYMVTLSGPTSGLTGKVVL